MDRTMRGIIKYTLPIIAFILIFTVFIQKNNVPRVGRVLLNSLEPQKTEKQNIKMTNSDSIDWEKLLHFIPDRKNQNCRTLFTTPSSKSFDQSEEYKAFEEEFQKLVSKSKETDAELRKKEPKTRWNRDWDQLNAAPQDKTLSRVYQTLAQEPWVKTVCEIGFDQGQSAIAWLTAKQDLVLHSFDIGLYPKTTPMVKYVKSIFNDRFHFYMGDSSITVPDQIPKLLRQCDIVSVDGAHTYSAATIDIVNIRKLAAPKHILIADDIEYPDVKKAWNRLASLEFVDEKYRCHIPGKDIDTVIGQFGKYSLEDF